MAVADVLRPLDGAEAQFTRDSRRRLSTALRESGRHQAGAAPRTERRRSHPPCSHDPSQSHGVVIRLVTAASHSHSQLQLQHCYSYGGAQLQLLPKTGWLFLQ